jgi:hypothetical protein
MTITDLVGAFLAAGGPKTFSPRRTWALHREIRELSDACRREGLSLGGLRLMLTPDPDVGIRVAGVDEAVWTLVRVGCKNTVRSSCAPVRDASAAGKRVLSGRREDFPKESSIIN